MNRRTITAALLLLAVPLWVGSARKSSILETKHNLSTSGKGEIRSVTETRICIFCHSSHNSSGEGPLWNHETTAAGKFKMYERSTMKASPEQPNGATKLCLSCHDGTIAVGAVLGHSGPIQMKQVGGDGEIPAGKKSHLGTDLTGTHPVSFNYHENISLGKTSLRWPPVDPEGHVGLDADGYMQCTACHDPHGSRSEKYPFWQKSTFSQVCKVCHVY